MADVPKRIWAWRNHNHYWRSGRGTVRPGRRRRRSAGCAGSDSRRTQNTPIMCPTFARLIAVRADIAEAKPIKQEEAT